MNRKTGAVTKVAKKYIFQASTKMADSVLGSAKARKDSDPKKVPSPPRDYNLSLKLDLPFVLAFTLEPSFFAWAFLPKIVSYLKYCQCGHGVGGRNESPEIEEVYETEDRRGDEGCKEVHGPSHHENGS